MRSPLTETIHRVQGMITYVRENLSTDEYMLYLDLLAPEPEVVKPVSKTKKKSASKPREYDSCLRCGTTKRDFSHKDQSNPDYHEFQSSKKSAHAQSLSSAIQRAGKGKMKDGDGDNGSSDNKTKCAFMVDSNSGELCGAVEDDPIHDLTYSSSHEFQLRVRKAASGD